MYLEQAMLIFTKDKGKGIQYLFSAEPDIARFSLLYIRLEIRCIGFANEAVDAVGCYQQVVFTEIRELLDLTAKLQRDAQFSTAALQNMQQVLARNAGNNM